MTTAQSAAQSADAATRLGSLDGKFRLALAYRRSERLLTDVMEDDPRHPQDHLVVDQPYIR